MGNVTIKKPECNRLQGLLNHVDKKKLSWRFELWTLFYATTLMPIISVLNILDEDTFLKFK